MNLKNQQYQNSLLIAEIDRDRAIVALRNAADMLEKGQREVLLDGTMVYSNYIVENVRVKIVDKLPTNTKRRDVIIVLALAAGCLTLIGLAFILPKNSNSKNKETSAQQLYAPEPASPAR